MKQLFYVILLAIAINCSQEQDMTKNNKDNDNLKSLKEYIGIVITTSNNIDTFLINSYYVESKKIIRNKKYQSSIDEFNKKLILASEEKELVLYNYHDGRKFYSGSPFKKEDLKNIFFLKTGNTKNEDILPVLMENGKIKSFMPVEKGDQIYWW